MIRNSALLTFILFTASAVLAQVVASNDTVKKLQALFEEDWQWNLKEFPEGATMFGDNRYNNLLTDASPEAIRAAQGARARNARPHSED